VKYTWIEGHRDEYSVSKLCRLLEVSRTGYLQWRRRPSSRQALANRTLDARVAAIHAASKRSYGRPRIVQDLLQGIAVGHERVRRSLQRQGLRWSMNERMKADLVCDALKSAYWRRKPAPGLILHSDRGSQYASEPSHLGFSAAPIQEYLTRHAGQHSQALWRGRGRVTVCGHWRRREAQPGWPRAQRAAYL
jgi:hypothetical protein